MNFIKIKIHAKYVSKNMLWKKLMNKLILTFDTEDFINSNAIVSLHTILKILNKYQIKAIFFLTGHMAEKLSNYSILLDLLQNHEIGYHSSSHSVHPIIPKFTDVSSYKQAFMISIERETSHINPITGKMSGEGGIFFLRDLFHSKKIGAYRAPGMSWSPPHLDALNELDINHDFSTNLSISVPKKYKDVTFYPYTFIQHWNGSLYDYQCLLSALMKRKIAVFNLHPTLCVNKNMWDEIYYGGNPQVLGKAIKRSNIETLSIFQKFEILVKQISFLKRSGFLNVDTKLNTPTKDLIITEKEVRKCYESSASWPRKFFKYNPKFMEAHFLDYFKSAYN